MYDYGNSNIMLHVFLSNSSTAFSLQHWFSASWYDANMLTGRMAAGDFNGDGHDDIAGMYDYGNSNIMIHAFISNGPTPFELQDWFEG